jgi:hypothetical protein
VSWPGARSAPLGPQLSLGVRPTINIREGKMEFKLTFKNTYGDYIKFTLYYQLHSRIIILVDIVAGLLLANIMNNSLSTTNSDILFRYIFVIVSTLLLLAALNIIVVCLSILSRILQNRNVIGIECNVLVNDDGINKIDCFNKYESKWTGIIKTVKYSGLIMLFISENMAYLIPERAFPSQSSVNEFLIYAKSKLENRGLTTG